jgi:hypothetical protein
MQLFSSLPEKNNKEAMMVELNVTDEEKGMLIEFLENYLSDLRAEVADTKSRDIRAMLKKKEEVLKKILGMLR